MIRIVKGRAPAVLRKRAAKSHGALAKNYDSEPDEYDSGRKTLKVTQLYCHADVHAELDRIQHGKCCYCEVMVPEPYGSAHVEHYRPKAYSQQAKREPKLYPGYYWLSYKWSNLYLSCQVCNSFHKKNLFPLVAPEQRARKRRDNLRLEDPLLLDPGGSEDPRQHIIYHAEVPKGVSAKGKKTIEVVGLADERHGEPRRKRLADLDEIRRLVLRFRVNPDPEVQQLVEDSREVLRRSMLPSAPYSAMVWDYFKDLPFP